MTTWARTSKAWDLLAMLLRHPCIIAKPSPKSRLLFTRSAPLSSVSTSTMTTKARRCPPTTTTPTDLDTIFKMKQTLRSRVKKDLKSMDPTLRSQEDSAIQSVILEAPWFKSCKRLCAYITCSALREVETSKLLSEILQTPPKDGYVQMGKKLYVPRVEDRNCHMRMLNISSMDDLIANSMNILEPAPVDADGNEREDVMLASEPVDLFLLPGLAFDKCGRRLGRGGGYYDTFLAKYQQLAEARKWKQPLLIALSYSVQIMDEGAIPITPNDVPVDALVTPSGVLPVSAAAFEMCH